MRRMKLNLYLEIALFILIVCSSRSTIAQTRSNYWVYFSDKGPTAPLQGALMNYSHSYEDVLSFVHPRALARRAKVLPPDQLVDYSDISVSQDYIDKVNEFGGILRVKSRWLNAASFLLTPGEVAAVSKLPMVIKVTPVRRFYSIKPTRNYLAKENPSLLKTTSLDYGLSAAQLTAVNVPQLHDIGITANNIIIGMLDSGFRWRTHESLYTRHVIAEHDFIWNRDTTANGPKDSSYQDEHGTLTFSALGGYMPGKLIGPAFNASFILAKTEWVPGEDYSGEEDNWAAGIEWEEGLGADVVSSSVGYNTFSDANGYTWENGDFNGRTSVTAKAAVRAARLGVVVCDAMGNEGNGDGVIGTMLTPADADSIVSVGAINFKKQLEGFSSTGPTNDGRFKPDVVAPGSAIYCADHSGFSAYFYQSGTSLATPLTAGSAALMLSARPELKPMQVINALHANADKSLVDARWSSFPNNFVGWGAVDALNAALSFGPIFSNKPFIQSDGVANVVSVYVLSKFGVKPDSVIMHYAHSSDSIYTSLPMALDSSILYPTSGRYLVNLAPEVWGTPVKFYIDARDSSGNSYRSPAPVLNTVWTFRYGETGVPNTPEQPTLFHLFQNFPNPFNPATTITRVPFDTPTPVQLDIAIFNILGQRVRILYQGESTLAQNSLIWNGKDDHGITLPSGVYICRMATPFSVSTTRMMIIR
ncbi:MAG: S8 family serine peptidase [Bacteroidota bacterium]